MLGFGGGNFNDHLAEQLAAAGNGNYYYVDTLNEGRKVLVEQLSATVLTIAQDVKIRSSSIRPRSGIPPDRL